MSVTARRPRHPCRGLRILLAAILATTAAEAAGPIEPRTLELLKTFSGEFVEITPGNKKFPVAFLMGSKIGPAAEQPAHEVRIAKRFAMARYEVPQNLYEAVMRQNPSRWKGERNSVEMIRFADAQEFCARVTTLLRDANFLDGDEEIRLPTEAEWEYCCRAGTLTAYSFGNSAVLPPDEGNKASMLDAYAWHAGNAAGNDPPVGAKKPNPWGLYDMHGYLWEFVADAWHDTYQDAPADGSAWKSDDPQARRVVRGGSWKDRYDQHRCASRRAIAPDGRDDAVGFRCVKGKVPQN